MPGEHSKHYYEKDNNIGQWTPTREASASPSPTRQNGRVSHDSPILEQDAEEQQQRVRIVRRDNAEVFDQQDESDSDEHLVIHAPPTNSLFLDNHENGENNNDGINLEYVPHTPTATPPPTPPSLPPTPENDFREPAFQDQHAKQDRRSPTSNNVFLNFDTSNSPNFSPRPHLQRETMSFPGGIEIQTLMDQLLNGNVTQEASRYFDIMAGAPPDQSPNTPYFSFFPGPGMYPVPTQLYCSYSFLLKCLRFSMSLISFREQYGTSSNIQNRSSGTSGTPTGPTSSWPPGFGMIRTPSSSSSRKFPTAPSATVTSQSSNTFGTFGRRVFAPPPPLLSPIRDGPSARYFVPLTNGFRGTAPLSGPTSSSAWRFTAPILHLQPPPSRHQLQQQRLLNLDSGRTPNHSSLFASASQLREGDTRAFRRDNRGEPHLRRDETRSRSRSRSQNRFRNERHERSDRRTDVNYHHHHYHRLSPHHHPYLFNNCRHRQDQRRCDSCRESWNSLLDFDYHYHASSSSSLRFPHDHNDDNDVRGRRRSSRDDRNNSRSKSDCRRRDRH